MKKNLKKYSIVTLFFLFVFSLCCLFQFNVNAMESQNLFFGPSSLVYSDDGDSFNLSGTLKDNRGGFVIPHKVNVGHKLSFDFHVLVDSLFDVDEASIQNRAYLITINEYSQLTRDVVGEFDNHINIDANGVQLEIRTDYEGNIVIGAIKKTVREENETITLSKNDNPYFYSAFYNKEFGGVNAEQDLNIEFFPSNNCGVECSITSATHFTFQLNCYKKGTKEIADVISLVVDKETISNNGGFQTSPSLGLFVINQPTTAKETNIDISISNVENGLVEDMIVTPLEIFGAKPKDNIDINVNFVPFDNSVDLSSVKVSYISCNNAVASVDDNGKITIVDNPVKPETYINVLSSEGNLVSVHIVIYDTHAPFIEMSDYQLDNEYEQYSEVLLPNFIAYDIFAGEKFDVVKFIDVISPVGYSIEYNELLDYYSFYPTEVGNYIIVYSVYDIYGNCTKNEMNFSVYASNLSDEWVKYGTYYSSGKLIEDEIDQHIHFTGDVGTKINFSEQQAGAFYSNPLIFQKNSDGSYTSISFSLKVNYSQGDPIIANNETEYNRYFMMNLVEENSFGNVGEDSFGWNMSGIHLQLGKRSYATEADNELLWYELRAGTTQLSRMHTTRIDPDQSKTGLDLIEEIETTESNRLGAYCGGAKYLPWFEKGQARSFAKKFNQGQEFGVRIEYFDSSSPNYDNTWKENYFVLTLDDLSFRIPAEKVAGSENGFSRQVYLGFKQFSSNGTIPFDITVSKIRNGDVRSVAIINEKKNYHLNDTFSISAVTYSNTLTSINDYYTFSSADTSIATVNSNGQVKIVGVGNTFIKATSLLSKKSGTYTINVDIDKLQVVNKNIKLNLGCDYKIDLDTAPNCDIKCSYLSSDNRIVAALSTGVMQAVGKGTATITISYLNHITECTITVVDDGSGLNSNINDNNSTINGGSSNSGCASKIGSTSIIMVLLSLALSCLFIKRKKY